MLSSNKSAIIDLEDDTFPPFFLISTTGPAADIWNNIFGLYRKEEGCNVYVQLSGPCQMFCQDGIWRVTLNSAEYLADRPSKSPTSVKWKYKLYLEIFYLD